MTTRPPTKRLFLDVNAIRLCCVDFGGDGPPALLLHGLAGRANEWRGTAAWLTARHHVFALDQRGHGVSDKTTRDYTRDAYVGDAAAVIEQLGLTPVTLIGQSMGGLTAFLVAARRPDLVRALIVVEATPARNPSAPGNIGRWLASWPVPFPTLADARAFFGGGRESLYAAAWSEVLTERLDGYYPQFDPDNMVASMVNVAARDYWAEWDRVQCPTLLVSGANGFFAAEEFAEMVRRNPHASHAQIVDTGHDLHLERPDAWRRVAEAFLTEHAGGVRAP